MVMRHEHKQRQLSGSGARLKVASFTRRQLALCLARWHRQGKSFAAILQETRRPNGKLEQTFEDGRRVVTFPNGTCRQYLPDGRTQLRFSNGDCKCQHVDGMHRLVLACSCFMIPGMCPHHSAGMAGADVPCMLLYHLSASMCPGQAVDGCSCHC